MAKESCSSQTRLIDIYARVTLAVIVLFTWQRCCSPAAERGRADTPARQMLAQQLNRRKEERTEDDSTRRGGGGGGGVEVAARLFPSWMQLLHRREASLCGSPNESRQKEENGENEETGKCFRVVPLAIPLLFNTDDAADAPGELKNSSPRERGKHCWSSAKCRSLSRVCARAYLDV